MTSESLKQMAPDHFQDLEQVIALLEYRHSNITSDEAKFIVEDLLSAFKKTKEINFYSDLRQELKDLKNLYAICHAQRDKLSAEVKELKAKLDYYFGLKK